MKGERRRLFPWRYGMFLALLALCAPLALMLPWHEAVMAGFDIAAVTFLLSVWPLLDANAEAMRDAARRNDANRGIMLLLTAIVTLVILIAVGVAVTAHDAPKGGAIALLLVTLTLSWIFSNSVYALHYAHICYRDEAQAACQAGMAFPGTDEPDYWDFLYFAFTLGMTFQTSDVTISGTAVRRIVLFHCLAAFIFNLGVIAFTINILGG
ncbi:DUF1345 domain-containing protein [Sphingobium algorifonticola]|uniref:DUF1345 domain-containing protein n=1 Tax=Sphingobium algorifonticola TaxID=2008318 RepID=A0A437JEG1_9SPHN|nr:DUF1345 domain-containing protein [Sphingobium algorifonticola]RVT43992.1 DUF1345 domain-containing protein [Sphingobium algorifonticola]